MNKTQALLARASSMGPEETAEDFVNDDSREQGTPAKVARSGYGTVRVYKLTPSGSVPIKVNVQSVVSVLAAGYSPVCFDCGREDCGDDVNDCPGRPPRKFRICPVTSCRKKIYDPQPTGKYKQDDFDNSQRATDDDNAIVDDTYSQSTPESRTKAQMDLHLIGFHAATAMEMGIGRPREMPHMTVVS